jgi:hypothetical protein
MDEIELKIKRLRTNLDILIVQGPIWASGESLGAKMAIKPMQKKKRFTVTSNLRYMHEVLNVDKIKN